LKAFRKYNKYCFLIFFSALLFISKVNGQATNDPREDFLYGEFYLEQKRFREALNFYLSSLKYNPDNCNINYRVGYCYMNIIGEQHKALPYLKKSVLEINRKYVAGKYKDSRAPIETWLLLGDANHRDNNLSEASYAYHKYKELIAESDKEKHKLIQDRIVALGISKEFQQTKKQVGIINLGHNINTRFSDYNPVLSGDEMTMIYTQFWESYDRVVMTKKTLSGWTQPMEINEQIGSYGNCYTASLSYDGSELYLICTDQNNYDIYVSKMNDSIWEPMNPLSSKINTRYHESSVCISSDGYYLYFASNRPGGEGGFDIYCANREESDWGNVVNLGPVINTERNEEAPFITVDGSGLYFSSDGHETIGNMDIMCSEINERGGWKNPINLGTSLNTTGDDIFFVYYKETGTGYFSRDTAEGFGKNDIYKIQTREFSDLAYSEIVAFASDSEITSTGVFQDSSYAPENQAMNKDVISDTKKDDSVADTVSVYTIQVMALEKHKSKKLFSISPLTISLGNDGLHRYTYGEFKVYSKALVILFELRKSGYPDAFIRNINTIQNYQGIKSTK